MKVLFSESKKVEIFFYDDVESREIQPVKRPLEGSLTESRAAFMGIQLTGILDKHYTREQVHAIAHWMLYLSSQA